MLLPGEAAPSQTNSSRLPGILGVRTALWRSSAILTDPVSHRGSNLHFPSA